MVEAPHNLPGGGGRNLLHGSLDHLPVSSLAFSCGTEHHAPDVNNPQELLREAHRPKVGTAGGGWAPRCQPLLLSLAVKHLPDSQCYLWSLVGEGTQPTCPSLTAAAAAVFSGYCFEPEFHKACSSLIKGA